MDYHDFVDYLKEDADAELEREEWLASLPKKLDEAVDAIARKDRVIKALAMMLREAADCAPDRCPCNKSCRATDAKTCIGELARRAEAEADKDGCPHA